MGETIWEEVILDKEEVIPRGRYGEIRTDKESSE
jgi:hypothetical protein